MEIFLTMSWRKQFVQNICRQQTLTAFCEGRLLYLYESFFLHLLLCREEELDSQGDASSQPDTISIASRTSQNTVDSDKVRNHSLFYLQNATRVAGVSLACSPHSYVISLSPAGVLPSSRVAARGRGKLRLAIFCATREPIKLSELYRSQHICVYV